MANTIAGNSLDNVLTGTEGDDLLLGYAGADTLSGLGGADVLDGGRGADAMDGGAGDDTYVVDEAGDRLSEAPGGGYDTVLSAVSWTLGGQFEALRLTGNAASDATGNGLANHIWGNIAANVIDGGGGSDTLEGGRGDDTYRVDERGDTIIELAREGADTVILTRYFWPSYALPENVENLVVAFGTYGLAITGNALGNTITGGEGDDAIDGLAGADTLRGGAGDDRYLVDRTSDRVIEAVGGGNDTVEAAASYRLSDNVETLILTGAAVAATGNDGANRLEGTDAANVIDGRGGADAMIGYGGDDLYFVDEAGDTITEDSDTALGGTDTVRASIDYVLGAGLENLALLGAAVHATGNKLANVLTGNALANVIDGGAGADVMRGGAGDDGYLVDNTADKVIETSSGGNDTVTATVSYGLGAYVETLVLAGAEAIDGTGNGGANHLIGNAAANVLDGLGGADLLEGGDGGDTYVVDNAADRIVEAAGAAGTDTVLASVTYALGDGVENLTLTGTANIDATGNAGVNVITGNAGDNVLDGGSGDPGVVDRLIGGAGNDTYFIHAGSAAITEKRGGGIDTVVSEASYYISVYVDIENVTLTGTGNFEAFGDGKANVLIGNDGNNRLLGLGGADTLIGGKGDDTYSVYDLAICTLKEDAGGGTDTVIAYQSYVLPENFENLTLIPYSLGKKTNGTGNAADNIILGTIYANVIDGKAGADHMEGKGGNDTFLVDDAGDVVVAGEFGRETIVASVDYTLPVGIEVLTLAGGAGAGSGNALDNVITGNALANRIDGGGGADRMIGGLGDDTYHVDAAGDVVIERAGGGRDTVILDAALTGSWTLGAYCEDVVLGEGARPALVKGNALANTITGNALANRIDGGLGGDTLIGGAGDDTYVLDRRTDTVSELAGGGTDTIEAGFTITLGDNIENLTLTGTAAAGGTGNGAANVLAGNGAANRLDGAGGNDRLFGGEGADTLLGGDGDDLLFGGAGGDALTGGAGRDRFVLGGYATVGAETITDFASGSDVLLLVNEGFAGKLATQQFVISTDAQDANDIVIYDKASGKLWFDADGLGFSDKVLIAELAPDTALAASDFLLLSPAEFNKQYPAPDGLFVF